MAANKQVLVLQGINYQARTFSTSSKQMRNMTGENNSLVSALVRHFISELSFVSIFKPNTMKSENSGRAAIFQNSRMKLAFLFGLMNKSLVLEASVKYLFIFPFKLSKSKR